MNVLIQHYMGGVSSGILGLPQAALEEMVSVDSPAAAPEEDKQPASAYVSSLVTLLTCVRASACEVCSHDPTIFKVSGYALDVKMYAEFRLVYYPHVHLCLLQSILYMVEL